MLQTMMQWWFAATNYFTDFACNIRIFCIIDSFITWFYLPCLQCVKSVRVRTYSGPHFPAFGLNTGRYSVYFRIQSQWGKIRTRITPNTETFYAVFKARERGCKIWGPRTIFALLLQSAHAIATFFSCTIYAMLFDENKKRLAEYNT